MVFFFYEHGDFFFGREVRLRTCSQEMLKIECLGRGWGVIV